MLVAMTPQMLKVIWGRIQDRNRDGTDYGSTAYMDDQWLVQHCNSMSTILRMARELIHSNSCIPARDYHHEVCLRIQAELEQLGPLVM